MFAEVLRRYPASFLGIQESNHFQTRFLIKSLAGHDVIGWHNPEKERWQSNLIFFHKSWTCLRHRHHFIADAVFRAEGFAEVFDKGHATTFHKFKGEETLEHIDWILYRGMELRQRKIITDSFFGRYPSDHYPVLGRFRL